MPVARVRRRIILAGLMLPLLPPAAYVAYDRWTDNFGAVEPGRVFRSGQMSGATLARTIRAHGIRTVLNLRGSNPDQAWYRDEHAAALGAGATQIDLSMSSCEWMSRAQLRTLIRVLDTCEYPVLTHCQWGSERTSLVSAIATLLRPGARLEDAEDQFSIRYLFVRVKDGKVMAEHLDQYKDWLRVQGVAHSPARFRQWAAEGFTPRWPSREHWPYDPKPLLVVTRPEAAPSAPPLAGAAPHRVRR